MTHLTVFWIALAAIRGFSGSLPAPMPQQQEVAQAVYAKVAPSVVLIVVDDANGKTISQGSGFVIEGNLIVTNAHVIRGGATFVHTGVAKVPCTLTRLDERADLAVLRAAVPLTAPALRAAPENTPIGTRVFALGNPQGLERTITEGLYTGPRTFDGVRLLQISAPISPGSSGGPIVDSNGLVVGIAASSLEAGQNLNFAVPVDTLIALLAQPETAPVPAPPRASAPAPASPTAMLPAAAGAGTHLREFETVLAKRMAMGLSQATRPQWFELRKRERDLLSAAINAARTDDELLAVHGAAIHEHEDIALDAAKLALQRAGKPLAWHYLGIAFAGHRFSEYVDEPRKTEVLREAKDAILKALPLDASGNAWLLAGQINESLREWAAAKPAFDLALKVGLAPGDRPAALRGLWRSSGGLNLANDADRWFAEFEKTGAASDADYYERASYLGALKRFAEAAPILERLAANPAQQTPVPAYSLWYSAAYARWSLGQGDAALAAASRAVALAPDDASSARTRAMTHALLAAILITRRDPAAVDAGRRAVQADPSLAAGHTQLARALNIQSKPVEAEPVARRAIQLDDTDHEAHFALATSLFFQNRFEEARASYLRAATINPSDGHAAFNVGLSLVQLGRPNEALPWYEEALRRNPNMPEREQVLAAIAKLKGGR